MAYGGRTRDGRVYMPPFEGTLTQEAVWAIRTYLEERRAQMASTLSGGERQSIAIARAMFFQADLIILDEPTNNLGVEETQGVLRFIRNARDAGVSCIFITHNIYHVFQVVDRIVVLRRGKKVCEVDPKKTTIEEVEKAITGMTGVLPESALI